MKKARRNTAAAARIRPPAEPRQLPPDVQEKFNRLSTSDRLRVNALIEALWNCQEGGGKGITLPEGLDPME